MPAGRKPKSAARKALTGNPGRRKKPPAAPTNNATTAAAELKPPPILEGAALDEWRRVAGILRERGTLQAGDRAALAAYCHAWAMWNDAVIAAREKGPVVRSPGGHPITNPYLAVAKQASVEMRQYAVELGLTPASRGRIDAPAAGSAPTNSPGRITGFAR